MKRYLLSVTLLLLFLGGGAGGWVLASRSGLCPQEWAGNVSRFDSAPYLTDLTADRVRIAWWSREWRSGEVTVVREGGVPVRFTSPPGYEHAVDVPGLDPGTQYRYEVVGGLGGRGTFLTDPGAEATIVAAAVGDSGSGSRDQLTVASEIDQIAPDLLLHTGDVVYPAGALCAYEERFLDPYAASIGSAVVVPAIGNHDLHSDNGVPFQRVFDRTAHPILGTSFVYAYGPLQVLVIDSERLEASSGDARATFAAWIEAALAAADRVWSIVLVHRPPFSNQEFGPKWSEAVRDLIPVFSRLGVDLVLSGHAHQYERFAPIDGVTTVVTGGGGASLRGFAGREGAVVQLERFHALRIDASPEALEIRAIGPGGEILDDFALSQSRQ